MHCMHSGKEPRHRAQESGRHRAAQFSSSTAPVRRRLPLRSLAGSPPALAPAPSSPPPAAGRPQPRRTSHAARPLSCTTPSSLMCPSLRSTALRQRASSRKLASWLALSAAFSWASRAASSALRA